jgi:transcriptional regulator with XRE-family HTH domain
MESNPTLALADNVRRLMADTGLSQEGLAKRAGISQRAVGYLVNYRDAQDRHPTTQTIAAIALAFDLEVWQLMMPNLPFELVRSKRLARLIENYVDAPESGRAQVERIAESEVRYAVAESALTGKVKSGTGKG